MRTDFYKFRCATGDSPDSAEILIFGDIGSWDDMGEVSAKDFARDLAALPASVKRLDVHINSSGGSLFEAQAIYSRLADHRSTKNVFVDGIAASAATIIAMVGHKIFIRANASMMIHMPSGIVVGNAEDMRQIANALDTVTESMINVYEKRTGKARDDIRAMLTAETWMSPDQAVEHGFADEVRGVVKAAAALDANRYNFNGQVFDLSRFSKRPAFNATVGEQTMPDAKPAEGGGQTTTDPKPPEGTPPPVQPTPPPEKKESAADAVAQERARVSALMELDRPATHELVTAAIKDGKSPTDILPQIMAAMDKATTQASTRAARHSDAAPLGHIPPSDAGQEVTTEEFSDLLGKQMTARLKTLGRSSVLHSRN